jgi:hypothetical protein
LQNRPAEARAFFADHPTAEAKSPGYEVALLQAQYQSDFNQIFTKYSPVHAKYGKVLKLTNNKIV